MLACVNIGGSEQSDFPAGFPYQGENGTGSFKLIPESFGMTILKSPESTENPFWLQ